MMSRGWYDDQDTMILAADHGFVTHTILHESGRAGRGPGGGTGPRLGMGLGGGFL